MALKETWQSPDSSIATVDNGTVTGIALGEVQIRASYQTASVTMRITVEAAPIGALKHPHIKSGCAETLPTALSAGGGDRDQAEVIAKVSAVARKSVILDGTSTTTCRGCMSEHRRQEPIWTSVRGAGVKAVSPAERGRSEATRLDVGEHTRTLLA